MGKFDINDLLKDLGEPDPNAPKEPSFDREPTGKSAAITGDGLASSAGSTATIETVESDSGGGDEASSSEIVLQSGDPPPVDQEGTLKPLFMPDDPGLLTSMANMGELLAARQVITTEQLASAKRVLKQTPGKRLPLILIEMGIEEAGIRQVEAELARLPFERVKSGDPGAYDFKGLSRLGSEFCKENLVLPLRREPGCVTIGSANPHDLFLLDDVRRKLGVQAIRHVLVPASDIRNLIESQSEKDIQEYNVDEILADVDEDDVAVVQDEAADADMEDAESSPVVRYVNHIIQTAVKEGASDIHIEPEEKTLKVRFRIDGVLFEMMNPPRKMHAAITSRLKIMANLDIAERRLPQDGRIRVNVLGRTLDLRFSSVPTPKGEKVVMRILDTRSINVTLDDLGFSLDTLTLWKKQIDQPHGIILVTGPTGSGKTTTLYSSLRQMDLRKLNLSTVEDPVEYNLVGVTQIQTFDRIGMTFAKALKAILRQDPDVIMVGEIRDLETATTAIQAALTGHLVLSTLHTNDAPASVTRLINIGIEPFLVGAALNAVLAQRLTRRICDHCKEPSPVNEEVLELLQMHGVAATEVMRGKGCGRCREMGYSGRIGLYELLVLDDFLRDKIAGNPNVTEFRRLCCERGMATLRQDGFDKVIKGFTTVEEILRVTQSTI